MGLACTRPDANSVIHFPQKVLLLGQSGAGKTSLLYGWKIGCDNLLAPLPTDGFNVEQIKHRGQMYIVWDLSGDPNYRVRWRQFYHGTNVLMIVIDSNDEEGLEYVKTDVHNLLQERDLKDIPCIVVFNKSDLACKKIDVLQKITEIPNLPNVYTLSCCAKDDNSLKAVLDVLDQACQKSQLN